MSDEKKREELPNKAFIPPAAGSVRVRFKPNRGAENVKQNAEREATVDAKTAERLVAMGYADIVK